jgi:hypothetical protein
MIKMMFGGFIFAFVVCAIAVQLGNIDSMPAEVAAEPTVLRNSLLVCLPISM